MQGTNFNNLSMYVVHFLHSGSHVNSVNIQYFFCSINLKGFNCVLIDYILVKRFFSGMRRTPNFKIFLELHANICNFWFS